MAGHPVAALASAVAAARTSLAAEGQCPRAKVQMLFQGLGAVASLPSQFVDPSVVRDALRCIALSLSAVRGNDVEFSPIANALFTVMTDRHHSALWYPPPPLETPLHDVMRCLFGSYVAECVAVDASRHGVMLEALIGPLPALNAAIYCENMIAVMDTHVANGAVEMTGVTQRLIDCLLAVRQHGDIVPYRPALPPQGAAAIIRLVSTRLEALLDRFDAQASDDTTAIVTRATAVMEDALKRGFDAAAVMPGVLAADVAALKSSAVLQALGRVVVPLRNLVRTTVALHQPSQVDIGVARYVARCFGVVHCLLGAISPVQVTSARWANVKPCALFDPATATPQNTEDLMAAIQLVTLITPQLSPPQPGIAHVPAPGQFAPSPSSAIDSITEMFILGRDETVARMPPGRKYTSPRRVPGGLRHLVVSGALAGSPELLLAVLAGCGVLSTVCTGVLRVPGKDPTAPFASALTNVLACALTTTLARVRSETREPPIDEWLRLCRDDALLGVHSLITKQELSTVRADIVSVALRNIVKDGTPAARVRSLVDASAMKPEAAVALLPPGCAWSLLSCLPEDTVNDVVSQLTRGSNTWTKEALEERVGYLAAIGRSGSGAELWDRLQRWSTAARPLPKPLVVLLGIALVAAVDTDEGLSPWLVSATDAPRLITELPCVLSVLVSQPRRLSGAITVATSLLRSALLSKAAVVSSHVEACFKDLAKGSSVSAVDTVLDRLVDEGASADKDSLLKRLRRDDIKTSVATLVLRVLSQLTATSASPQRKASLELLVPLFVLPPAKDAAPTLSNDELAHVCRWLSTLPLAADATRSIVRNCLERTAKQLPLAHTKACAQLLVLLHHVKDVESLAHLHRKVMERLTARGSLSDAIQAADGTSMVQESSVASWLAGLDAKHAEEAQGAEVAAREAAERAALAKAAAEAAAQRERELLIAQQRAAAEEARLQRAAAEAQERAERERRHHEQLEAMKAQKAAKDAELAAARAAAKEEQAAAARSREAQIRVQRTTGEWKARLHRLGVSNTEVTSAFAALTRLQTQQQQQQQLNPSTGTPWSFSQVLEFVVSGSTVEPWTVGEIERRVAQVKRIGFREASLKSKDEDAKSTMDFWASLQQENNNDDGGVTHEMEVLRGAREQVAVEAAQRCLHARVSFVMDAFAVEADEAALHPAQRAVGDAISGEGFTWFIKVVEYVNEVGRKDTKTTLPAILSTVGLPLEKHVPAAAEVDNDEVDGAWYRHLPHPDLVGALMERCAVPVGYIRRCCTSSNLARCPEAQGQVMVLLDVLHARGVLYFARHAGIVFITPLGWCWHQPYVSSELSFLRQRVVAIAAWEAKMAHEKTLADAARARRRELRATAKAAKKAAAEQQALETEAARLREASPTVPAIVPLDEEDQDNKHTEQTSRPHEGHSNDNDEEEFQVDEASDTDEENQGPTQDEPTTEPAGTVTAVEDLWETMGIEAVVAEIARRHDALRREARLARRTDTARPHTKRRKPHIPAAALRTVTEQPTETETRSAAVRRRIAEAPAAVAAREVAPVSESQIADLKLRAKRKHADAHWLSQLVRRWAPTVVVCLLIAGAVLLVVVDLLDRRR